MTYYFIRPDKPTGVDFFLLVNLFGSEERSDLGDLTTACAIFLTWVSVLNLSGFDLTPNSGSHQGSWEEPEDSRSCHVQSASDGIGLIQVSKQLIRMDQNAMDDVSVVLFPFTSTNHFFFPAGCDV